MNRDAIGRVSRKVPFWDRVEKQGDCLIWTAGRNFYGYGIFRQKQAHRVAFEERRGPIPEGMDLDHLCRNRACVNPDHLEPVTRRVNLLRGETHTARNAAATHCPHGHEYSVENTRHYEGGRFCRTCSRFQGRAAKAARRFGLPGRSGPEQSQRSA